MAEDDAAPNRDQPAGASDEAIQSSDAAEEHMRIVAAAVQTSMRYAGPIPPPEMLAQYEEVLPGIADRIMTKAERQQAHRHKAEMTLIRNDGRQSMAGMAIGGAAVVTALVVAGVLAAQGYPWFGTAGVLGTIASLAGVFVYGTHSRRKERATRLEETLTPTVDVSEPPVEQPSGPQLPRE